MKIFKRTVIVLLLLAGAAGLTIYFVLLQQKPVYSGQLSLPNLKTKTDVWFDAYGIPHIYGQSEEDVFRTLGYVQAQDRLFQMEIIRRVSAGRLSEIFGSSVVDIDRFFRMLGMAQVANKAAEKFSRDTTAPAYKAAVAYLDGVNAFQKSGNTPIEFRLLHIAKEPFGVRDIFLALDFMAFNFQVAFRTDPLMTKMLLETSDSAMADLGLTDFPHDLSFLGKPKVRDSSALAFNNGIPDMMDRIDELLPQKIWCGSNAWVISPSRSASGKVLFANDTHVGHQLPAVWYEAYLEYPGQRLYGSFFAGFPFAATGHTMQHAWGLTIFENDDLDFYAEKTDALHTDSVFYKDHWTAMDKREEIIKVKDSSDIRILCRSTIHGPVCSDVMKEFRGICDGPVALSWTYLKQRDSIAQAVYNIEKTTTMSAFRNQLAGIYAPGLNVLYGDSDGNIGWWTAAKIVRRAEHQNSSFILDGSTGSNDWLGYYDFSENPNLVNPENGYVFSANNDPGMVVQKSYPGYYLPRDRAERLQFLFASRKLLDKKAIEEIQFDVTNTTAAEVAHSMMTAVSDSCRSVDPLHARAYSILSAWNGRHGVTDPGPVIYYKVLYNVLHDAFADEIGEKDFSLFLKTNIEKSCLLPFMKNPKSIWWDNIRTAGKAETEREIISKAFEETIKELSGQLGNNVTKWEWGKVHMIEMEHPIGKQKPFDRIFNSGPYAVSGGIETVFNQSFVLDSSGFYVANLGPAMRRILDFSDPENAENIIPGGQSGNVMSAHYEDQAALYMEGKHRKEQMNRVEIEKNSRDHLIFMPSVAN